MRTYSSATRDGSADTEKEDDEILYHSIISNSEHGTGESDTLEFKAETRKLLDIVAKSLYSEKEVFIRELISNASDAIEKMRYYNLSKSDEVIDGDSPLEIHIACDDDKKTFIIQDTGIGMTREELIDNLGTIARSGSKDFLGELEKDPGSKNESIIGQFGVGFYASFMVADSVEVFTQSWKPGSKAQKWTSDGLGSYSVNEAEGVTRGTKILLHLKGDCYDFAKEEFVKEVVTKYSNFVGVPIYLNGSLTNTIEALWLKQPKEVTEEMHQEFYKFVTNAFDTPRYNLHYKADAPLNIRALFYIPDSKPSLYDMSRDTDSSLTLYSKRVMILRQANNILPKWLRFVKGVVDSEDIPLNLSRELLQDSSLIRKLRWVLTNRLLKFFQERMKKDKQKYDDFFDDYGMFFREGIVTTPEQQEREQIAKLLRFESSELEAGERTNLDEYITRMKAGNRNIYYLAAPNRQLAESSPYFESMRTRGEILFCYEPYDELVLMNLGQFDSKVLKSIENEMTDDGAKDSSPPNLNQEDKDDLLGWIQINLGNKINKAKLSARLVNHPCVITVPEMGAARHFLRTTLADKTDEERYRILQPVLEVNYEHPIIETLSKLKNTNPEVASLLIHQLYDNAMIVAGLMEDPRAMIGRLNELLTATLQNQQSKD